ncbi:hypothetical protein QBC38DRAFT_445933 [Podospora fimiseda]|uniref:Uncharacterized protein n=1 Tax=Podospora fimiseda TaxID=252190 RepID=A0AAN7GR61_9PEZI|nr:hypothetical protein QBC38DRAFT_445933 [Podospora fimiseda]
MASFRSSTAEFFEVVNMTLEELESWIGILSSKCSDNDLESADDFMKLKDGLVVDGIMRRNPERRVELCTPEDIDNMRRITGYVHLHLGSPNRDSNRDRNLKRWGHDTLKTQQQ